MDRPNQWTARRPCAFWILTSQRQHKSPGLKQLQEGGVLPGTDFSTWVHSGVPLDPPEYQESPLPPPARDIKDCFPWDTFPCPVFSVLCPLLLGWKRCFSINLFLMTCMIKLIFQRCFLVRLIRQKEGRPQDEGKSPPAVLFKAWPTVLHSCSI